MCDRQETPKITSAMLSLPFRDIRRNRDSGSTQLNSLARTFLLFLETIPSLDTPSRPDPCSFAKRIDPCSFEKPFVTLSALEVQLSPTPPLFGV